MALFSDPALVLGDDGALVWPLAGFAAPRMALVASLFVGQSVRSGGAAPAAIHGLPHGDIQHLAGVRDPNWLSYYNRNYLGERLRISRAVGL